MSVNQKKFQQLKHGVGYQAALVLADTANAGSWAAVATTPNAAALTAPATMNAAYTQTEVQALRADVAALQAKLNALLTNMRTAGILLP